MTKDRIEELQREYLPLSLQPNYKDQTVSYKLLSHFLNAVKLELLESVEPEKKEERQLIINPFKKFKSTEIEFGDIYLLKGLRHYAVYIGSRLDLYMFITLTSTNDIPCIPTQSRFLDSYFTYTLVTLNFQNLNTKANFMGLYDNDEHLVDIAKEVLNFYKTDFK
jgi:hypothetical protein